ncbi:hypothetical protein MKW94_006864 [Papaver nudicaule]|uniref:Thionin-like protein 2 n=1 Tax=Papaver nudicaule TaxID=74823 RepID=A0AA41VUQ5_PAPNU|nr:hypothetical protein [Papaver nudicaule]
MKSATLIVVIFLLLVGTCVGETIIQPNSFKKCYDACIINACLGELQTPCLVENAPACAKKCLFKQSSPLNVNQQSLRNYCVLGCGSYNCFNISTPENLRGEEVEGCLGSCSNKCDKKY